ncbi:MAG: diaminopimelate epimerase [Arachidicoccus sp.]|nr:diaminopimelate epimerase [Arachidicoccus sp.]
MNEINFYKYQGTGNDFVMIDGREDSLKLSVDEIKKICNRRFGIGSDGLIIIRKSFSEDFEMDYYNADGTQSFCGNGGRCAVKFVKEKLNLLKNEYRFTAIDGVHTATFDDKDWVNLRMKSVDKVDFANQSYVLNTGSPHYVKFVNNVKEFNVVEEAKKIRYNDTYKKDGINVNFVSTINDTTIFVRTYERGVENETYSCGTGVTAAGLVSAHNDRGFNRIEVQTLGGKLAVEFDKKGDESFDNILLCGPAEYVFKGSINI